MSDIKTVEGIEFKLEHISLCEGCHFYKPHLDEECSFPLELEMGCGHDTVYKIKVEIN